MHGVCVSVAVINPYLRPCLHQENPLQSVDAVTEVVPECLNLKTKTFKKY